MNEREKLRELKRQLSDELNKPKHRRSRKEIREIQQRINFHKDLIKSLRL